MSDKHNYSKQTYKKNKIFISWSQENSKEVAKALKNTLEKDILISKNIPINIGDIIIKYDYERIEAHKIVAIDKEFYQSKGINNDFLDSPSTINSIMGKVIYIQKSKNTLLYFASCKTFFIIKCNTDLLFKKLNTMYEEIQNDIVITEDVNILEISEVNNKLIIVSELGKKITSIDYILPDINNFVNEILVNRYRINSVILHASGVIFNDKVVLFIAKPKHGKSTAMILLRQMFNLQPFCDDMCIYDCTSDTLYPVISAFHIRDDVIGMLPKDIICDSYCDPEEKSFIKNQNSKNMYLN